MTISHAWETEVRREWSSFKAYDENFEKLKKI